MIHSHTTTVELELSPWRGTDPRIHALWPYAELDDGEVGDVYLELECHVYPGEPATRCSPGAGPEVEIDHAICHVAGHAIRMPSWVLNLVDTHAIWDEAILHASDHAEGLKQDHWEQVYEERNHGY